MRKAFLVLLLLLLPSLVLGQAETTGKVSGRITDEEGNPIAGVKATLSGPAIQGERSFTTDANGKFLAPFLPPGSYLLVLNAPEFQRAEYSFPVGVGQIVPLDIEMKAGGTVETVTVYGTTSKLETTAGGENFNFEKQIDELPVTNRDLMVVATLAPNVSFGFTRDEISISGAPSYENSVLLDGADISDPFYSGGTVVYLEEAIEELQVITNGVSARYGRFQGGVLNATTKSGGNTFDGTVRVDLSKESWNSQTPFGENQTDDLNKVYSATIGGPIVKDRLWFFVGGRTIPATSETKSFLVATGAFTEEQEEDRFQVKLTGSPSQGHTIEASYLDYDGTVSPYDPFDWSAHAPAVIPSRDDPRKYYTGEYQGILSDRLFVNAQYSKKDVSIVSGGDPNGTSPLLELFNGEYRAYGNGWFDPNDPSVRDNESMALNLTQVLSTDSWGDHTLEYGIQYVNSITAGDNRQSPTGFNLYFNEPNTGTVDSFADCDAAGVCTYTMDPIAYTNWRLKAIPGAGEQEIKNTALYVQDDWEYKKWRFNLGLRWENWDGNAISPAMTLDFDEVSPRAGVTYNISPEWQVQGTWGKYVARFNDGIANGVTGISSIFGPGVMQEMDLGFTPQSGLTPAQVEAILTDDANWDTILAFVDPLQPTTFFADDIAGPYAQDLNLSVKRALPGRKGVVTVTYTKRDFKELLEDFKGGGEGIITVTLPDMSTEDVDRVIWDNCSICARDYQAVTASWDYRPSAVWDLGGNYTYSETQGNYEGESLGQPSIGSIIGNYPTTVDAAAAYPFGYLNSDVRHRARVWGHYRFDFERAGRLTIGSILLYRSGGSYSLTARVPAGSDPGVIGAPSTFTKYFDGRGNNRFEGFWSLDTTLRYDVAFHKDVMGYIKLDIENITGEDSLISHRTGGTAVTGSGGLLEWQPLASFGTASSERNYQTPRSYLVSVGVTW